MAVCITNSRRLALPPVEQTPNIIQFDESLVRSAGTFSQSNVQYPSMQGQYNTAPAPQQMQHNMINQPQTGVGAQNSIQSSVQNAARPSIYAPGLGGSFGSDGLPGMDFGDYNAAGIPPLPTTGNLDYGTGLQLPTLMSLPVSLHHI